MTATSMARGLWDTGLSRRDTQVRTQRQPLDKAAQATSAGAGVGSAAGRVTSWMARARGGVGARGLGRVLQSDRLDGWLLRQAGADTAAMPGCVRTALQPRSRQQCQCLLAEVLSEGFDECTRQQELETWFDCCVHASRNRQDFHSLVFFFVCLVSHILHESPAPAAEIHAIKSCQLRNDKQLVQFPSLLFGRRYRRKRLAEPTRYEVKERQQRTSLTNISTEPGGACAAPVMCH